MKKFEGGNNKFGGSRGFDKRGGNGGGRDFGGRSKFGGGSTTTMFKAVCSKCGDNCEVPFKPSGNKPVLCSDCFRNSDRPEARRSEGRDRDFSRSNFGEKKMFEAVCVKCGHDCELPFKPSGDRPVYCSVCFGQENANGDSPKKDHSQLEHKIELINGKLDAILKMLSANTSADSSEEPKIKETAKAEKAVKPVKIKKEDKRMVVKKTAKKTTKK